MTTQILASASPGEVRVAMVRDGSLLDYAIWRPGAPDGVGDRYRGRITARVAAMAGVFVALGGTEGFLPDSEGGTGVTEGELVLVQVTRAAQGGKGPRLAVQQGAAENGGAIGLIARGGGPLVELADRHPEADVRVDDPALLARLRPRLGARLSFDHSNFHGDLADQMAELEGPVVDLPGGARLRIHPTPALVAIDVDAAGALATGGAGAAAHLAVNRSVIPALARQIRLRNLSGAILVDFAGLSARRRTALGPALGAALTDDPLHPRLLGFTALGFAEIVRARVRPPLHELLVGPHAAGLTALRCIAAAHAAPPHRLPALRIAPAVIAALEADAEALPDLARRAGRPLILRADAALGPTEWVMDDDRDG